jgi:hypothetical protein
MSVVGAYITALSIGGLALSDAAAAAPSGGWQVDDAVRWLQDEGYHVQLNGQPNVQPNVQLSRCIATGIHGLRGTDIDSHGRNLAPEKPTTVYVDISCFAET